MQHRSRGFYGHTFSKTQKKNEFKICFIKSKSHFGYITLITLFDGYQK